MQFIFKAKDQQGVLKEGKIESISHESAIDLLQKNGLTPISIERVDQVSGIAKLFQRMFEGVSQKELSILFQQLAILIEAKVPIVQALSAIAEQVDNRYLQTVINEVRGDIEDGMALSESFRKHPDVFNPLIVSMVKAGEVSGNLQRSISFIAENIEKNYRLTSRIRSAFIYPGFIMSVAAVVGFVVVTIVLPKLTDIIRTLDMEIPWFTKVLISFGDFMSVYWWAVILAVVGVAFGFIYYIRTESGRKEWDQVLLKIPIVKSLMCYVYMTRFTENLAVLLDGGIPIVKALDIVSEIMTNHVYHAIMVTAADEVRSGGNISTVLAKSADIPAIVTRMVRVGEETGKLSEILKKAAAFYDQETDRMTKNMSALIEPIMIVFLGIGVMVMVMGILLPIYDVVGKM